MCYTPMILNRFLYESRVYIIENSKLELINNSNEFINLYHYGKTHLLAGEIYLISQASIQIQLRSRYLEYRV